MIQEEWEKIMNNNINVVVVAHFNGFVIKNTEEGVIFMSDEPVYFFVSQTTSFEELNDVLYQGINAGTHKRVVKIKYRCPISNLNNKI